MKCWKQFRVHLAYLNMELMNSLGDFLVIISFQTLWMNLACAASPTLDLSNQHSILEAAPGSIQFHLHHLEFPLARSYTFLSALHQPNIPGPDSLPNQEEANPALYLPSQLITDRQEEKRARKKDHYLFLYLNNREMDTLKWGTTLTFLN